MNRQRVTFLSESSLRRENVVTAAEYYDKFAPTYDNLFNDEVSIAENEIVSKLLRARLPARGRVLDLGCGTGLGYSLIGKDVCEYHGVDSSKEMIKMATMRFCDSKAKFNVADMSNLMEYDENSFDMVISLFGSFSHSINSEFTTREISRILVPGGKLFVMTYSHHSFPRLLARMNGEALPEVCPYRIRNSNAEIFASARFFTKGSLIRRFKNFEKIEVIPLNIVLNAIQSFAARDFSISKRLAIKIMLKEQRMLHAFSDLAHSLIIVGEKRMSAMQEN